MSVKARNEDKLLMFLGNPENEFLCRSEYAVSVLGYKNSSSMYRIFSVEDLNNIEAEALQMRRQKMAATSAKIDNSVVLAAQAGDMTAAKLYYQRIEGWSEKQIRELEGEVGLSIEVVDRYEK